MSGDNYTSYAAFALRWALGERAHRLTSVVAGLLPDMIADAVRQIARWRMPLEDTPIDAIPYMLRAYGLPEYIETYWQSLLRLRNHIETHERAGAQEQLIEELERAGLANCSIVVYGGENAFWIDYPEAGAEILYDGSHLYGAPEIVYGSGIDPIDAHNVIRLMRYFRPARERWAGFVPPP